MKEITRLKHYGYLIMFIFSIFYNVTNASDSTPLPSLNPNVPPITKGNWYKPSVSVTWQWQLTGVVNTSYPVEIYDIDLFDSSRHLIQQLRQSGHKVICYFSAGSFEDWRLDKQQFDKESIGLTLDGWPNERWLDIRSKNIHAIMKKRLDIAKQKGCDGVEPDNMDAYTNQSGFNLSANDQLAYNRFIANEAHLRGLAVGLKNDLDQVNELVSYFDFSVNEQCFEYSECNQLMSFVDAGKPVLNVEYKTHYVKKDSLRQALCKQAIKKSFSTLILPLDLDDSFRFSCLGMKNK